MKSIFKTCAISLFVLSTSACSHFGITSEQPKPEKSCAGTTDLPGSLKAQFVAIEDSTLLQATLGEPEKGKLCQGQVYQSKPDSQVTVYRAWNSTNPNSRFGNWWAFNLPRGKIAQYREDYEICYQWSPLDKMVACTLKANAKVVVGNGQSAFCSDYLTYPVSAAQQVYLDNAKDMVLDCKEYDGVMSWHMIQ